MAAAGEIAREHCADLENVALPDHPDSKVAAYLAREFAYERLEREKGAPWPLNLLRRRLNDLYWIVMRLCKRAYAHVHEGARTPRRVRDRARSNRHLFRVSGAGDAGGRLLIDVTDALCRGFTTGVQRVVRELVEAAAESGDGFPVFLLDGRLFSYSPAKAAIAEIEVCPGDRFIMADITWHDIAGYRAAMRHVAGRGGRNVAVLYDIMPISWPMLYPPDLYPGTSKKHAIWFDAIIADSDAVVAISKSVAEDFLAYVMAEKKRMNPLLRLGWSHLGADFQSVGKASARPAAICNGATPFFLSVGSLEPRKGLRIALEAMELIWRKGFEAAYVIAGAYRSGARALARDIRSHPEYGRRLFWLDRVADADLRDLYESAHGLIYASVVEGFGLPLVEAAHFGLPAIASDIPVFREIGGDAIAYFDAADPESLAAKIGEALARPKGVNRMAFLTWRAAAQSLLGMVRDEAYQFGEVARLLARRARDPA